MSSREMTLVFRLAEPKTDKERMFRVEIPVDTRCFPGEAFIVLEGKEYKVEVHY